jgi:hypothetical protein
MVSKRYASVVSKHTIFVGWMGGVWCMHHESSVPQAMIVQRRGIGDVLEACVALVDPF